MDREKGKKRGENYKKNYNRKSFVASDKAPARIHIFFKFFFYKSEIMINLNHD